MHFPLDNACLLAYIICMTNTNTNRIHHDDELSINYYPSSPLAFALVSTSPAEKIAACRREIAFLESPACPVIDPERFIACERQKIAMWERML